MNQKARQHSASFLGGKYKPATAAPKLRNAQAINPTVKANKIGGSISLIYRSIFIKSQQK
jgi:hypothetical protein